MPHSIEDDFSKMLLRTGALQFGMFTLSGGRLSPYYLDLRVIPSFPDSFRTCSDLLAKSARSLEGVDKIGGIPTGGLPWASVLAYSLAKPLVYTRKDVKLHGRERTVEGILTPGERVLLVDDVITTGKNIVTALQSIRGEGGVVEDALVLLDREEGGEEHLQQEGVKLHSVARISSVAQKLLDMDAITKTQFEELTAGKQTR
ncbi:MAG TPA: orotate phosphoribosyltransferase [Candidatus Bathyarchaeia archaeon]|jgi:orotate phosphoribosyltransferase|nr:orotate phosphoribosyltransferase [Candidatus Bathyarchaeia archaeon]